LQGGLPLTLSLPGAMEGSADIQPVQDFLGEGGGEAFVSQFQILSCAYTFVYKKEKSLLL